MGLMNRDELQRLRDAHQPYRSQTIPGRDKFQNCQACSEGRGMQGGIGWPCLPSLLLDEIDRRG